MGHRLPTTIVFPTNFISKPGRIPCRRKDLSSKVVSRVFNGTNFGDPKALQQNINMTHVEAPSSTIVRPIVLPPWTTSIDKATWYGRRILT